LEEYAVNDPTYVKKEIEARPEWRLAFFLSELENDDAPLGWGKYIWKAEAILKKLNEWRNFVTPATAVRKNTQINDDLIMIPQRIANIERDAAYLLQACARLRDEIERLRERQNILNKGAAHFLGHK
jgi:hypothetical protein